jgi:hypothetical protein
MSHNIADVSVWTSPIGPVPDPGDPGYTTSVVAALQGLANRSRLLADTRAESAELAEVQTLLQDQIDVLKSAANLTRVLQGFGMPESVYSGGLLIHPGWELTAGGLWRTISTWTGGRIFYEVELPHGCRLWNLLTTLTPATGHIGWPVQHPPQVSLYANGSFVTSVTDTADDISYETPHTLDLVELDLVINRATTRYTLAVNNEYGTNSKAAGLTIGVIIAVFTPDSTVGFDKGAA